MTVLQNFEIAEKNYNNPEKIAVFRPVEHFVLAGENHDS